MNNSFKFKWFTVYLLVIAIVTAFVGNSYACLFPISMITEKAAMNCETSERVSSGISSQSDDDCNQALLDDGRVSHIGSFFQLTVLRLAPDFSKMSSGISRNMISTPERVPFFVDGSLLHPPIHHSVPIYTSTHSFLI
ncbi:MAG: hypothetical protein HY200_00365 [Nitrospirae bacterium]|nr:hypothetical protein [Nitrospirota bacterium]